jgi:hypothetical protein
LKRLSSIQEFPKRRKNVERRAKYRKDLKKFPVGNADDIEAVAAARKNIRARSGFRNIRKAWDNWRLPDLEQ